MNERIRELAKKAGAHISVSNLASNPVQYRENIELWDDRIEKFAELLVEECCNRLSEETIRHDGYGYNQHELYNRLRKHFGVEK